MKPLVPAIALALWGWSAHAQCPAVADPTTDASPFPSTAATATAAIDAARTAENPALPTIESQLPANYTTLPPDQQTIVLINAERTARGFTPLNTAIQGQNDLYLGNITANHSLLVALNPNWWNLGIVHSNAVDGTPNDRVVAPPGLALASLGEIIAANFSPEGAVWAWMYADSASAWGHRHIILDCSFQMAGAGVAASAANTATWGANAIIITVDFVTPQPSSTYTQVASAADQCPTLPKPSQYTCPVVAAPKVFGLGPNGSFVSLTPDGSTITVAGESSVDALNGTPNSVTSVFVFSPANWGAPSGTVASLGQPPKGSGAFSCPLTPLQHTALDPNDPAVADADAVSVQCSGTLLYSGDPVVLAILDTFNDLSFQTFNLSGGPAALLVGLKP